MLLNFCVTSLLVTNYIVLAGCLLFDVFQIDDRKASYKEVATLLRGCGIDLDHNRFLILQVIKLCAPLFLMTFLVVSKL